MRKYNLIMLLVLMPMLALAQAGSGVGGGGFTEPEMKGFMNILSDYFATKDYSVLFPEVVQWEQKNNSRMAEFIMTIEPKVVNHPVYFPAGVERDCVSYVETQGSARRRWFECNSARVPESKLENQPKLYALLAHEIFVQAGIEKAGDANVPSTYESSSRFLNKQNLILETIQRYVPGIQKTNLGPTPFVRFVRDQLSRSSGVDIVNYQVRKISYGRCFGEYLAGEGMIGDSKGTRSKGKVTWNAFPESYGFSLSLVGDKLYKIDSVPTLPYTFNDIQFLQPRDKSLLQYDLSYNSPIQFSSRIHSEFIVIEGSVDTKSETYKPLPSSDLRSQFNSDYQPLIYLMCDRKP